MTRDDPWRREQQHRLAAKLAREVKLVAAPVLRAWKRLLGELEDGLRE